MATPGDIIHNVDEARAQWKEIWHGHDTQQAGQQEMACLRSIPMVMRDRIQPEQIRRASKAFSAKTTAADGWHPRVFQYLTDTQLLPLCWVYSAWEYMGRPALPGQQLMVKMIPKPTSGHRPTGLFPTPFRPWGKIQQPQIKMWMQDKVPDAAIAMAPGRAVGDSTWRQKV